MAAAALRGSWCRCPQRCFGSGIQFLSSHNLALLPHGTHQIRRPGGEQSLKTIESETVRTSEVIRRKLGEITGSVKESLDEVSKSDFGRKIKEGVEEAAKTAKQSAESVSKGGEKLGRTAAFKALSQGVESVKKEIDESVLGQTGPYRRPERLRRRKELSGGKSEGEKVFEPNEEALGVVLHKDSKWYQQWKDFRDNNVVFNRFFEMKLRYDESDNALIRASRALTDKVTDLLGGLFSKTEMSEVLTEILRVDPAFDKDRFLRQCEKDIIPNVLEAMICGELDILKDWCYEATYSQLAHPIQQAKALGLQFHSRVLDIDNVDLAMGKMMEQGPVLIITFQAQLVMVIKNPKGELVEGDPRPCGLAFPLPHPLSGSCRTRCCACCMCGPSAETRTSSTPTQPGGFWTSPPPVQSRFFEHCSGRTLGLDDHAVDTQGQVLMQQGGLWGQEACLTLFPGHLHHQTRVQLLRLLRQPQPRSLLRPAGAAGLGR
ncbi:mitochondrial import inner membrane translocase subunit TIM44 isoform X2 [Manis pentadactyla]|uniref:mitochondrial import inner membrane translocase subunit TIM44 isoform X2 n=1 Tax=Manis pentadactyla TaxID=143292 RepID=UPI00255C66AE|nr:mitochondrial import inner membrane translocase subunit TIM44 isoform X2 [Manis pentadactyla]